MATGPSAGFSVVSDADRIEKWNLKLTGDLLSKRVEQLKPMMLRKVTAIFPVWSALEVAVKTVLDEEGISTTQYPYYLSAARQMLKAKQRFAGNTLISRIGVIMQRWIAEGFVQAILERIRDVVLTIAPPGP